MGWHCVPFVTGRVGWWSWVMCVRVFETRLESWVVVVGSRNVCIRLLANKIFEHKSSIFPDYFVFFFCVLSFVIIYEIRISSNLIILVVVRICLVFFVIV